MSSIENEVLFFRLLFAANAINLRIFSPTSLFAVSRLFLFASKSFSLMSAHFRTKSLNSLFWFIADVKLSQKFLLCAVIFFLVTSDVIVSRILSTELFAACASEDCSVVFMSFATFNFSSDMLNVFCTHFPKSVLKKELVSF